MMSFGIFFAINTSNYSLVLQIFISPIFENIIPNKIALSAFNNLNTSNSRTLKLPKAPTEKKTIDKIKLTIANLQLMFFSFSIKILSK